MTTTVFLVRHASHDGLGRTLCGRMPHVSLSAAGKLEAVATAAGLATRAPSAIYASPLERALETAAPLARRLDLAIEIDEDLTEIDFGEWTGAAFDDLDSQRAWSLWNTGRSLGRPPGGETMLEAQVRVARFLDRAIVRHAGGQIVAFSHADVIKAALAHALGLSLDQHARLEVSPASVSVVVGGDWGLKVHSINEAQK